METVATAILQELSVVSSVQEAHEIFQSRFPGINPSTELGFIISLSPVIQRNQTTCTVINIVLNIKRAAEEEARRAAEEEARRAAEEEAQVAAVYAVCEAVRQHIEREEEEQLKYWASGDM